MIEVINKIFRFFVGNIKENLSERQNIFVYCLSEDELTKANDEESKKK